MRHMRPRSAFLTHNSLETCAEIPLYIAVAITTLLGRPQAIALYRIGVDGHSNGPNTIRPRMIQGIESFGLYSEEPRDCCRDVLELGGESDDSRPAT